MNAELEQAREEAKRWRASWLASNRLITAQQDTIQHLEETIQSLEARVKSMEKTCDTLRAECKEALLRVKDAP